MDQPLALVIDDEPDISELLAITLERMKITAHTCCDITTAKKALKKNRYQLCLTDMRLPDGDGLDLVEWMQQESISVPVAIITAHGNVETAVRALKLGAFDFISKPVDLKALRKLIMSAMKLRIAGEGETRLLGKSDAIKASREMIAKVARSQAPVHISGESGTGKELVARMIHEQGPRAYSPFVPVNCGAIPAELVESEFFGHKKGAFTGAVNDKEGLFQAAEGGTLFLDEIADLPLAMQVKLLRVIQEKLVRPIGGTTEIEVDVRILSATHKRLGKMVKHGQFRKDLYYRINVIELKQPPLRDRGNDILILSNSILERLSIQMDIGDLALTESGKKKLMSYNFPGNVRELENVLERAATLCDNNSITGEDIHLKEGDFDDTAINSVLGDKLDNLERDAIIKALEKCKHNKTAAAKELGITLRALRYRIQKLNI